MKLIMSSLALTLLVSSICSAQTASIPTPPGRMVDINGRKLHLNCSGHGSPTIVLEAGLGDPSLVWALVQPKLATTTRVCSYDRSGTAWSHDAGPPHGLSNAADDLDRLLRASGEQPPYLLVGHSWGGWLVTVYAHRHLGDVAGIVLVDSSVGFDPPVIEKMPESKGGGPPVGPMVTRKSSDDKNDPFKRLPPASYQAYSWTQSLSHLPDVDDPDEPLATVQAAIGGEFPLDSKPLVLILARKADGAIDQDTKKGKAIRSKILSLSRSSALESAESGHHVQLEKPEAVVVSVRNVLGRVRFSKGK